MQNNIPGWMSKRDLKILSSLAHAVPPNGNILEIGTFLGRSTKEMFDYKDPSVSITVVDTFDISKFTIEQVVNFPIDGDLAKLQSAVELSAKENSWRAGFEHCIGKDVYKQIAVNIMSSSDFIIDKKYDMVFIDGDHSYEGISYDIKKFYHLETLLVGDDFNGKFSGIPVALSEHRKMASRAILIPEGSKIWISVPLVGYWKKHFSLEIFKI